MREKVVEAYLRDEVLKHGGISYKWSSPQHRGVPDRIVIFKNVIAFVEVKTEGGVLSKLQQYVINILMGFNCNVEVVYNKKDVDNVIQKYKASV